MRIVVVSVGRLRAPYADDVAHYERLLSRYARLESVELRDDPDPRPTPAAEIERRLPARAFVSLLSDAGRQYTSRDFSLFLEERRQSGRELAFVIGGAYGAQPIRHDHELSLGAATLPHQLARVVLLEQLYRAHKILAGEPYHH